MKFSQRTRARGRIKKTCGPPAGLLDANLHTMKEGAYISSFARVFVRCHLVRERESINIRAARNDKFGIILKHTRRTSSFVARGRLNLETGGDAPGSFIWGAFIIQGERPRNNSRVISYERAEDSHSINPLLPPSLV